MYVNRECPAGYREWDAACTRGGVVGYLVANGIDPAEAEAMAQRHENKIDQGRRLGSRTYFVGDKILRAEGYGD